MTGTNDQEVDQVNLNMDGLLGHRAPILKEAVCGESTECPVQTFSDWTMDYTFDLDGALPAEKPRRDGSLLGMVVAMKLFVQMFD
jgi:hypothetical protein